MLIMGKRREEDVLAVLRSYIDCPHCGRYERPTGTVRAPYSNPAPYSFNCCLACERCGYEKAVLHVEREVVTSQ